MHRLVVVAALAGACYSPTVTPGLPCGPGEACPHDLVCDQGVCVGSPGSVDAAADGASDGTIADGAGDGAPDGPPAGPAWIESTPLPAARTIGCLVAHDARLYFIGGSLNAAPRTEVWMAPILANGAVGTWTATTALPTASRWHACVTDPSSRAIYMTGGDLGTMARPTVLRAAINLDGTLGAWTPQADLPAGRRGHGVVLHAGYLHVLGGEQADGFQVRDTVYTIQVGAAGTIGAWTTSATALPNSDYMFGTAVAGGRVFLTGGYNGDARVDQATLGNGGAVGTFTPTTALPTRRERHVSVSDGDELFVFGGEQTFGGMNLDTALRAPVGATGVGAWTALPSAPHALAYATAAYWNGHMYVAGGSDDNGASARVLVLGPL